jgi:hypothetical protein
MEGDEASVERAQRLRLPLDVRGERVALRGTVGGEIAEVIAEPLAEVAKVRDERRFDLRGRDARKLATGPARLAIRRAEIEPPGCESARVDRAAAMPALATFRKRGNRRRRAFRRSRGRLGRAGTAIGGVGRSRSRRLARRVRPARGARNAIRTEPSAEPSASSSRKARSARRASLRSTRCRMRRPRNRVWWCT